MRKTSGGRWADTGKLGLLCLVLTPLTILVHELGHFAVALFSGLPAELHPTSVSGGAAPGSGAPWLLVAVQAAGGPLLTIAMSLAGAIAYKRKKRLWALALALAASSRIFVTSAYLGLRLLFLTLGRPFGGKPVFDEYSFGRAIGVTPEYVAIAATIFLLGLLYWLFRRVERRRRLPYLLAAAAAIVAGNWLLATYGPPVLASAPAR